MSGIIFSMTGDQDLVKINEKMMKSIPGISEAVRQVNRKYQAVMLETLIRHSSGRPGPEVVTGDYNSSYNVEVGSDEMSVGANNSSPQSDRLEFGFIGVDARGRHYQQPPFPHFRPTLDELIPRYKDDISKAFSGWWK